MEGALHFTTVLFSSYLNRAASAWDFFDGKDYRIKQCSAVGHDAFVRANHEMAHIHYSMAYQELPYLYRWSGIGVEIMIIIEHSKN